MLPDSTDLQVDDGRPEDVGVVLQKPNAPVAGATEQTTNVTILMAMIDVELPIAMATDGAEARLARYEQVELFLSDAALLEALPLVQVLLAHTINVCLLGSSIALQADPLELLTYLVPPEIFFGTKLLALRAPMVTLGRFWTRQTNGTEINAQGLLPIVSLAQPMGEVGPTTLGEDARLATCGLGLLTLSKFFHVKILSHGISLYAPRSKWFHVIASVSATPRVMGPNRARE